jgi:hypothetical protein
LHSNSAETEGFEPPENAMHLLMQYFDLQSIMQIFQTLLFGIFSHVSESTPIIKEQNKGTIIQSDFLIDNFAYTKLISLISNYALFKVALPLNIF